MSLKLLIAFALGNNCKMLIVFGDSKNVINWINGTQRYTNIRLANIVEDIKFLQTAFDSLTFRHVYKKRNEEADRRSKEGANLDLGIWKISEFLNDHIQEHPQQTFL
jgi:hypothetical protein